MWKETLRRMTGVGAVAALFAVAAPPVVAQADRSGIEPAASEDELAGANVLLRVDGMSCPFCAYGLEKRLREISSIDDLVIGVSDGLVQIRLVEGGKLTDEELDEAVKRAGFSLREIQRLES